MSTALIPCDGCGVKDARFRCEECQEAYWCSDGCRHDHWFEGGHGYECVGSLLVQRKDHDLHPDLLDDSFDGDNIHLLEQAIEEALEEAVGDEFEDSSFIEDGEDLADELTEFGSDGIRWRVPDQLRSSCVSWLHAHEAGPDIKAQLMAPDGGGFEEALHILRDMADEVTDELEAKVEGSDGDLVHISERPVEYSMAISELEEIQSLIREGEASKNPSDEIREDVWAYIERRGGRRRRRKKKPRKKRRRRKRRKRKKKRRGRKGKRKGRKKKRRGRHGKRKGRRKAKRGRRKKKKKKRPKKKKDRGEKRKRKKARRRKKRKEKKRKKPKKDKKAKRRRRKEKRRRKREERERRREEAREREPREREREPARRGEGFVPTPTVIVTPGVAPLPPQQPVFPEGGEGFPPPPPPEEPREEEEEEEEEEQLEEGEGGLLEEYGGARRRNRFPYGLP